MVFNCCPSWSLAMREYSVFLANFVCCRFICSRSGRVRWTGQLGKWPGPSSSLFSYLRSISNQCSHTSQMHHNFGLYHIMFCTGVVFLFTADRVQNEQSSNCKVFEVNFYVYIYQKSYSNHPYLLTWYLPSSYLTSHIMLFTFTFMPIFLTKTSPPSYLTSHIYFMLFLSLSCVAPPHPTVRDSLFPHWYVPLM